MPRSYTTGAAWAAGWPVAWTVPATSNPTATRAARLIPRTSVHLARSGRNVTSRRGWFVPCEPARTRPPSVPVPSLARESGHRADAQDEHAAQERDHRGQRVQDG